MTDLHWLTAAEIGAEYAARRLSPVTVVQSLLDRIDALDRKVRSFIKVDGEAALDAARDAEREMAAGRMRGPLHGVPIAIKDNIDIAGMVTTCHSKIMLDNVAREDADVVRRLRAAGAILVGKLALHEFAFGGPTNDAPFPPACNPWNIRYHPGGSSSGSGAALAAGFVPITLGTDTAGSIRNPAGACGVVGIKPTFDLLSRRGVFPLAFTVEHVGPMARTVRDIALSLDVLAQDNADAPNGPTQYGTRFGADLDRGARGLRVGYVRHFHEKDMVADPQVSAALDEVVRVLKAEGADVRDVQLPRLQELHGVAGVIWYAETWAIHAKWLRERPEDYTAAARRKLMRGAFLTAGDYVYAQQCRTKMIDAVNAVFRDVDVLVTGSSFDPICRIDDTETYARNYARQGRSPFNMTGHPALAMMAGLSTEKLPLSVQFVGRHHDELTLLRAASAYERATDWHKRRAPIDAERA